MTISTFPSQGHQALQRALLAAKALPCRSPRCFCDEAGAHKPSSEGMASKMETSGLHDDIDHDNKEDEDEDDDDPHWWWLRQKENQVTQFEIFFWESTFPASLLGKPIAEATPKQTAYRQTHQHGKPKQPIAHGEKRKLRFPSCTGPKFRIIVTQTWSKDTTNAKGSSFLGYFGLIWEKRWSNCTTCVSVGRMGVVRIRIGYHLTFFD